MEELTGLSEETRKLALDRFRLLRPHLEKSESLRSVALAAGIPYRTAHRWVSQYRQFGLAALARKARGDRGARRAVSPKITEAIEGLALRKPLEFGHIKRQQRGSSARKRWYCRERQPN